MAFFKRNDPPEPNLPQPSHIDSLLAPATAEPGDGDKVSSLLDILDSAISRRSTDLTYDFGIALNRAGGFPNTSDMSKYEAAAVILEISQAGGPALQRPWLWLAAVARDALVQGDMELVRRISMSTWIWSVEFAPKLNMGAFFEGVVTTPAAASLAQIYTTMIRAAMISNEDNQLVSAARHISSIVIDQLHNLVEPDVLASARQLAS
jgi:hypothetical protein